MKLGAGKTTNTNLNIFIRKQNSIAAIILKRTGLKT